MLAKLAAHFAIDSSRLRHVKPTRVASVTNLRLLHRLKYRRLPRLRLVQGRQ